MRTRSNRSSARVARLGGADAFVAADRLDDLLADACRPGRAPASAPGRSSRRCRRGSRASCAAVAAPSRRGRRRGSLPSIARAPRGCSRSSARSVTLLPEPDSPMQRHHLAAAQASRSTPLTAHRTGLRAADRDEVTRQAAAMSSEGFARPDSRRNLHRRARCGREAGSAHVAGATCVADRLIAERRASWLRAHGLGERAARVEAAAGRRIDRVGRVAGQAAAPRCAGRDPCDGIERSSACVYGWRGCRRRRLDRRRSRRPGRDTSPARGREM